MNNYSRNHNLLKHKIYFCIVTFNYLTNDIVKSLSTRIAKEYLKRANIEYEPDFTEEEMNNTTIMNSIKKLSEDLV